MAVPRYKCGQSGLGITVLYYDDRDRDERLPGCARRMMVMHSQSSKCARRDANAALRTHYAINVWKRVVQVLKGEGLRLLTFQQVTYDWYLMRFGLITITCDYTSSQFLHPTMPQGKILSQGKNISW